MKTCFAFLFSHSHSCSFCCSLTMDLNPFCDILVFYSLVDVKPINQCPCILLHSLSHCISVFILPTCLYLLGLGSSGLHQLCNTSSKIWHVSTAPTTWLNLSCFFSSFFRGFRSRPSSISIIKKCLAWIKLGPQVSLKKMSCAVLWLAR